MTDSKEILQYFEKKFEFKFQKFIQDFKGTLTYNVKIHEQLTTTPSITIHEFDIESTTYKKNLKLTYSTGINVDNEVFHFFDFRVNYSGKKSISITRDSFSLPDYYQHVGKKFKRNLYKDKRKDIDAFFRKINDALFKHGLSEMLCQKIWTNISINFDAYK